VGERERLGEALLAGAVAFAAHFAGRKKQSRMF
jgi:hypothetical protein